MAKIKRFSGKAVWDVASSRRILELENDGYCGKAHGCTVIQGIIEAGS